jgi:hypothetical protein
VEIVTTSSHPAGVTAFYRIGADSRVRLATYSGSAPILSFEGEPGIGVTVYTSGDDNTDADLKFARELVKAANLYLAAMGEYAERVNAEDVTP